MNNREIANQFNLLANLMELHEENPFKIRSYQNAYNVLKKLEEPLSEMENADIEAIPGVGKAIFEKINEMLTTGQIRILKKYKDMTPSGVVEMIKIRGLGPKKIKAIWQILDVKTPGELLYACNENKLIELSGFGLKSQEDIRNKVEYYLNSLGSIQLGYILKDAEILIENIRKIFPDELFEWVGSLGKREIIVESLDLLCTTEKWLDDPALEFETSQESNSKLFKGLTLKPVVTSKDEFGYLSVKLTSSDEYFAGLNIQKPVTGTYSDKEFYEALNLQFIPSELRTNPKFSGLVKGNPPDVLETSEIKGIIHAHSTYSDGINDLKTMAGACIEKGFEYLVITDHSQSAGYAGGLKVERIYQQWDEIDTLNKEFSNFRILKGIESDIHSDGSLDYPDEILQNFEIIIASIHSGMAMSEERATERLINAIKNPFTNILGHPTGRLLLGRPGYPINHIKIIEACAEYNVAIELNANPQRLDLDLQWIEFAVKSGVKIAVNPDAHSIGQIDFINLGVLAARKGGLRSQDCLNTMTVSALMNQIKKV
jgi:DNA polymerase (family 10)